MRKNISLLQGLLIFSGMAVGPSTLSLFGQWVKDIGYGTICLCYLISGLFYVVTMYCICQVSGYGDNFYHIIKRLTPSYSSCYIVVFWIWNIVLLRIYFNMLVSTDHAFLSLLVAVFVFAWMAFVLRHINILVYISSCTNYLKAIWILSFLFGCILLTIYYGSFCQVVARGFHTSINVHAMMPALSCCVLSYSGIEQVALAKSDMHPKDHFILIKILPIFVCFIFIVIFTFAHLFFDAQELQLHLTNYVYKKLGFFYIGILVKLVSICAIFGSVCTLQLTSAHLVRSFFSIDRNTNEQESWFVVSVICRTIFLLRYIPYHVLFVVYNVLAVFILAHWYIYYGLICRKVHKPITLSVTMFSICIILMIGILVAK